MPIGGYIGAKKQTKRNSCVVMYAHSMIKALKTCAKLDFVRLTQKHNLTIQNAFWFNAA